MEHVRDVLKRAIGTARARKLAPLEPNAFLSWAYYSHGLRRAKWESPLTLDDVCFEFRSDEFTCEEIRRSYIRIAAKVRRNQRLGRDPWEGIL